MSTSTQPLRAALAGLRGDAPVRLAVGRHELVVTTPQRRLAEPKVALPRRWIRGLAEAQAIQAGLEHRLEVPGVEAWRFLRSLPRSGGEKLGQRSRAPHPGCAGASGPIRAASS